jgi:succinate dehydrogenase / fumarate reductase cytochrome b subunit
MKKHRFLHSLFWSTVGEKLLISLAGLALFIFIIFHLLGNLTLVFGGADAFNVYSHKLISLGLLLYIAEILLATAFLFHMTLAVITTFRNLSARSHGYVRLKSAGNESKKTLSSRTMIYSGIVIITFTIIHLITFKYGPGIKEGYVTSVNGVIMRDLYRLVVEVFHNKWYVIWYVAALLFLGFHLRHGFWSAFQSLGANNPASTRILYGIGLVLAVVLAGGFLFIPLYVYFVL